MSHKPKDGLLHYVKIVIQKINKMRIEEFLKNNGNRYDLYVIGEKDGMLQIEIHTRLYDGENSTRDFLVKDNLLFPIETE